MMLMMVMVMLMMVMMLMNVILLAIIIWSQTHGGWICVKSIECLKWQ